MIKEAKHQYTGCPEKLWHFHLWKSFEAELYKDLSHVI